MISIDGISYNAEWVTNTLEQTADIINGDDSGRLQGSKAMYLDYVGTFFNHKGQIRRGQKCTDKEWNKLFFTLTNPINDHTIIFPFGSGKITLSVYISQVTRKLVRLHGDTAKWTAVYDVTFPSMESSWLAGDNLTGYTED